MPHFSRVGTTPYKEVYLLYFRYNFSFPGSGPLDDDRWHLFVIVLTNGWLKTSLDAGQRHSSIMINIFHYFTGQLRLGYYEENDGTAHHFQGSLGRIDAISDSYDGRYVWERIIQQCASEQTGYWGNRLWDGMHLATPLRDCASRGKPFLLYIVFI